MFKATAASFFALSLALVTPGCGNTSGTNGGGSTDMSTPSSDLAGADLRTPLENPDFAGKCYGGPDGTCAACIAAQCNAEIVACVGANWQTTDDPNSVCGNFYECECTCKAAHLDGGGNGDVCLTQCRNASSPACQTCFDTLFACLNAKCSTACK